MQDRKFMQRSSVDISARYEVVNGVTKMLIELRDTEETFRQLLLTTEMEYFKPLVDKEFIKKGDVIYNMFTGLVGIRKISAQFLVMMKKEMDIPRSGDVNESGFNALSSFSKNCTGLWKLFSKFFDLLKLYSVYITQYNKETLMLRDAFSNETDLGKFINEIRKVVHKKKMEIGFNIRNEKTAAFDLHSLMITPIQRLPRLKMLLESMCKIFAKKRSLLGSKYSIECSKVQGAYDLVCYICEYVNNKPKQIRSDETLKQVIKVKYWIDETKQLLFPHEESEEESPKKINLKEIKKEIKVKRKELKEIGEKIEEEAYVKKNTKSVMARVEKALNDFEVSLKNYKKK